MRVGLLVVGPKLSRFEYICDSKSSKEFQGERAGLFKEKN